MKDLSLRNQSSLLVAGIVPQVYASFEISEWTLSHTLGETKDEITATPAGGKKPFLLTFEDSPYGNTWMHINGAELIVIENPDDSREQVKNSLGLWLQSLL